MGLGLGLSPEARPCGRVTKHAPCGSSVRSEASLIILLVLDATDLFSISQVSYRAAVELSGDDSIELEALATALVAAEQRVRAVSRQQLEQTLQALADRNELIFREHEEPQRVVLI